MPHTPQRTTPTVTLNRPLAPLLASKRGGHGLALISLFALGPQAAARPRDFQKRPVRLRSVRCRDPCNTGLLGGFRWRPEVPGCPWIAFTLVRSRAGEDRFSLYE